MVKNKKRSTQAEAVRKAMAVPERLWFISWRVFRGPGFWTNYREISISVGDPPHKFHSEDVPESAWTANLRVWPFRLIIFKHRERVLWLGDGEWKKHLLV